MLDYLNKAFPDKKESYRLTNLINDATPYNFDEDPFWREIIANVKEINRLRNYPEHSDLQPEEPFIQGDKPNESKRLPDVIYLGKDFALGIECFDFDSSGLKHGSKIREENAAAEKKLKSLTRSAQPPFKLAVPVEVQLSYSSYVASLLYAFRKHAKNIETYRNALANEYPGKDIYLVFFIEDVTQIGNYIKSGEQTVAMNPVFVKEFVSELLTSKGLDYVITCYQELYSPHIYLQKMDSKALMDRLNYCYTDTASFFRYRYEIQSVSHKSPKGTPGQ